MTTAFDPNDLAGWSHGKWCPHPPIGIEGVCSDTRSIKPRNLYVALKGPNHDGHHFVAEAFKKGASAAVVDADWADSKSSAKESVLRVEDTGKALRAIASGHRLKINPAIVAVTGSVGKSTVKEMISQILSLHLPTASTKGNWNNDIGLPLSLLAMEAGAKVGVFEVGMNHPGELESLCAILKPDWAVITNVGPVHIEFFGSVEAIAREKAAVVRSLSTGGTTVLDRDGEFFELLQNEAKGRVITISRSPGADYFCTRANGTSLTVMDAAAGAEHELQISFHGQHNISNALLSVAVARGFGVPWDTISKGLGSYKALPMRWEQKDVGGITLVNDAYNANPVSMRAALQTFEEMKVSRDKWLVLGGMLELGKYEEEEHLSFGRFVAAGQWKGVITVGRLGDVIADGAARAGLLASRIFKCRDNVEAAMEATARIKAGDAVLMKASRGIHLEQVAATFEK